MVKFDFCGNPGDKSLCSDYFVRNSKNMSFLNQITFLSNWTFNLTQGVNDLYLNETNIYDAGSIVMVTPLTAKIAMMISPNSPSKQDFIFLNNTIFSDNSSYFRIALRVKTTRYLYSTQYYDNNHRIFAADTEFKLHTSLFDYSYFSQ